MLFALAWQDHAVIIVYLGGMLLLGAYLARRQTTDDEYFLAGRSMPWLAVGMSVIASLLSSLTYLSEPGEVWKSGVTHVFGKMLGIPLEMLVVWIFCVPFMMRFRYTSAYEYLGHRFGSGARRTGAVLFILMVVLWMGFVVLASSRALASVSGVSLWTVILTVGAVATLYTMLGGLRAVIWTDVIQVVLLIGGGLFAIGYVAVVTGTWLPDWYQAAARQLTTSNSPHTLPFFSADPFVRATVVTVAINMTVWHICTHTANQMTVQRYFSTRNVAAARRSFVAASLFGVGINLMLVTVGLAVLYFYFGRGLPIDGELDPETQRDLIFPTFAVSRLPAGVGGAILAALLAAAMSSIDSGINSIATVISVETRMGQLQEKRREASHVTSARLITAGAGGFITVAACLLTMLPEKWGIVGAMPRTFNAITAPLGGIFLVGMFLPRVRQTAVLVGAATGMATSILLGYIEQITERFAAWGLPVAVDSISFTWIMPFSLLATLVAAVAFVPFDRSPERDLGGLTWYSRDVKPGP